MGSQADDDPGPGQAPRPGGSQPELLAAFEHGGAWETAAPSAALAAALQAAAGPEELYDGAGPDAMVGITRQWTALESWAAAGTLGSLRALTREDGQGRPLTRRRSDLPDGWGDNLIYEIAGALAMGPVSATNLAGLAWTLGLRLPGIGRLLADGTLTKPKAKLIVQTFEPLSEDEATRAEALILGELAGKTWFQVQRLAWRAALAVAPDIAERRRIQAEKRRARVTLFREESGAVGLSGRDLPTDQALAGHANVLARAERYEASGAFPDHTPGTLQALAYLHLLRGVTIEDAIAFARTATAQPPDTTGQDDEDDWDPFGEDPRGKARRGAGDPGNGRSHGDDDDDDDEGPDDDDGWHPSNDGGPGNDGDPADDGEPGRGSGPSGGGDPGDPGDGGDPGDPGGGSGPGDGDGPGGDQASPASGGGRAVLPEVTAPLATLQRRAKRPGDNRLLGPLDPALTRDLATAAARSPHSRWEITIVDDHSYAVGHGIARPRRGKRHQQQPQPQPLGRAWCACPHG